jgi:predicted transcriptional regulator
LMRKPRRDPTEIKYRILLSAMEGSKKTTIMYRSGLNMKQLNRYLAELLQAAEIEYRPELKDYVVTDKGLVLKDAIERYREAVALLNDEEARPPEISLTRAM